MGRTYTIRNASKLCRRLMLIACLMGFAAAGFAQPAPPTEAPALQGPAARGRDLFSGGTRFRNGGPPCLACHTTAGIGFSNGGTMAPNLTGLYHKLGPEGTAAAMQTLYFPVMSAIYTAHPVEPSEQADLLAFFQATANQPAPANSTGYLVIMAIVLGAIFVAITGFLWRKRVLGVRATLVRKATEELRAAHAAKARGEGARS